MLPFPPTPATGEQRAELDTVNASHNLPGCLSRAETGPGQSVILICSVSGSRREHLRSLDYGDSSASPRHQNR